MLRILNRLIPSLNIVTVTTMMTTMIIVAAANMKNTNMVIVDAVLANPAMFIACLSDKRL